MTKLKNLLHCYAMGMGIKSISSAFHVSRNTVRKYVRRYQESGLTLEQLLSMSEVKVQDMFLDECNRSRKASPRIEELEALIPDYVKRLSHKGVTVKSLHEEYLREPPDGYLYSNFKRAVRRYKYQSSPPLLPRLAKCARWRCSLPSCHAATIPIARHPGPRRRRT